MSLKYFRREKHKLKSLNLLYNLQKLLDEINFAKQKPQVPMLMGGQEGGDGACFFVDPGEILTFSTYFSFSAVNLIY